MSTTVLSMVRSDALSFYGKDRQNEMWKEFWLTLRWTVK